MYDFHYILLYHTCNPVLTFNTPQCKQQRSTNPTTTTTAALQRAKVIGDHPFTVLRALCISFASKQSVKKDL